MDYQDIDLNGKYLPENTVEEFDNRLNFMDIFELIILTSNESIVGYSLGLKIRRNSYPWNFSIPLNPILSLAEVDKQQRQQGLSIFSIFQ